MKIALTAIPTLLFSLATPFAQAFDVVIATVETDICEFGSLFLF